MLDLFGCVAISTTDVELWLDNLPNFSSLTTSSRREQYAKNYDLASIISRAKLNGTFALLEKQQTDFVERRKVSRYETQYSKTQHELDLIAALPCPKTHHECTVKSCKVRIKLARARRNKRYYRKKIGMQCALSESDNRITDVKTLT